MVSLSLLKRWSIRTAAVATLLGTGVSCVLAEDAPWLVLQTAGSESSGEVYDTYLINGETTGAITPVPGYGQQCLPGGQPIAPGHLMPTPTPIAPDSTTPPTTPPMPVEPGQPTPAPAPDAGMNQQSNIQPPSTTPPFNNYNQDNFVDFGQGLGSQTLMASRDVPAMVGDFFGGGLINYSGSLGTFQAPDISNGALGRLKLAENTNPIPTDRLYANYSYFNSTIIGGIDVNRLTLGAEKTFLDQAMSFEIRLPMAATLNQDILAQGGTLDLGASGTSDYQMGNLQMYLKGILLEGQQGMITAGLGISLPTADDTTISFAPNGPIGLTAKNEAVHLLPFVGGVYTPDDRFFATTLLQFDIDMNGQKIYDFTTFVGRLHDQEYLFLSQGIGYWMVREQGLRIAPIAEVHYNQSLSGARTAGPIVGGTQNISLVNGVLGLTGVLNEEWRATAAYVMPIGAGAADEQFDGEFRFMLNWYFGPGRNVPAQSSFF